MRMKKFYEIEPKRLKSGKIILKHGKFVGYFVPYHGIFKTKEEAKRALKKVV